MSENRQDKLTQSIKKLSQYDEWEDILGLIKELREAKFQALAGGDERTDAKIIGAMAEDDYIYNVLSSAKTNA